jgi:hypothetical protein
MGEGVQTLGHLDSGLDAPFTFFLGVEYGHARARAHTHTHTETVNSSYTWVETECRPRADVP